MKGGSKGGWLTPFDPNAMELRTVLDWFVKPQLRTVPGVVEVNSFGGYVKQYQVLLDPAKLVSHDLTLREVFEALTKNNRNAGGAYIEHQAEQYIVRGVGLVNSVEDIQNVIVTEEHGTPLRVKDVAEVTIGPEVRQGAVTKDGKGEVVAGITMMLKGANSRTVVQGVKQKIAELNKALPKGVRIVPFYDRTELVEKTIHTVEKNLLEGGLLVIAILFLLLGNVRAALIVASAIPLSMLFAFIGMERFGISGNLMSLGAIDFGLIVDGAVVMIENTMREVSEQRGHLGRPLTRSEVMRLVLESSQSLSRPIVFGVGIIIIVYLPIMTLEGFEGKMFKPMAFTVALALTGSLLLTLTLVPVLAALFVRGDVSERENPIIARLKRVYVPALRWAMNRRGVVLSVAAALFAAAAVLFPRLGAEFIPRLDEGSIAISALRLPSVSLRESMRQSQITEAYLREKFPEIETIVTKIGRAELATDPAGPEHHDMLIMLKPRSEWKTATTKEGLVDKIATALNKFPGISPVFSQPIELRVNELISGVRADVAVKIWGDDMDVLQQKAQEIAAVLGDIRGSAEVRAEQVTGLPMLQITVNRQAIQRYGINVNDVQEVIETAIGGKEASEVIEGERRFDLVVRFPKAIREDVEAVKNTLVSAPNGQRVPLSQLAEVHIVEGPAQVSREFAKRRVVVECNVRFRDIGSFVAEAEQKIAQRVKLPAGYYITWGGTFENLQRARARLMVVVPLSLFLIFMLLFTTFNSLKQAALVFTGVPLAVTGGVFSLWLRGMPFSISAGVGFIALFGVAVLNGVVMVTFINQLRDEGMPLSDAVMQGCKVRLRPVLMTALVASLGFIPMALSHGTGAEAQRPLATVVIGGLVTSTILTLFVLPALYAWFEREEGT